MAEYRNPKPTADVIVEMPSGIVLIERSDEPHGWAIPGGFVDEGEPVEAAAVREMREEIGIEVTLTELLYVYSDPRRDPRRHTMSSVFIGRPANAGDVPRAGDDAKSLRIFPLDALPPLVFDHGQMMADYRTFKRTGKRPDPMARLAAWVQKSPLPSGGG